MIVLFALFSSCGGTGYDPPANDHNTTISFSGYLDFCHENFESSKKILSAEVYVEGIDDNGNPTIIFSDFWDVENNTGYDNTHKDITVPETGSYTIGLTITGKDCFSCCEGTSCGSDKGKPKFYAKKVIHQQQTAPGLINIFLEQVTCL